MAKNCRRLKVIQGFTCCQIIVENDTQKKEDILKKNN